MALCHSYLQQEVAVLKLVAAEGRESVMTHFVALRTELELVNTRILQREKSSNESMQDLEVQLMAKLKVSREFECESV